MQWQLKGHFCGKDSHFLPLEVFIFKKHMYFCRYKYEIK